MLDKLKFWKSEKIRENRDQKIARLETSLKYERKYCFVIQMFMFLVIVLLGVILVIMPSYLIENIPSCDNSLRYLEEYGTEINYEDLDNYEIMWIEEHLVEDLNELYLIYPNEVIFVGRELTKEECWGTNCDGVNELFSDGSSIIKIESTEKDLKNKTQMRENLCHELLHTVMMPTKEQDPHKDPLHAIIYALGEKQVCYDKSGGKYLK